MSSINAVADEIHEKGFHVIDHFLPVEVFCNLKEIAETLQNKGAFKLAKIGQQQQAHFNERLRKDKIYWLDTHDCSEAVQIYLAKVDEIAKTLNQFLFLGLLHFESHFAIYQPGSFYKKHVDQFTKTKDRRISCVYYLNEHWEEKDAGELRLYNKNHEFLFSTLPIGNRFICFQSDLPHEVCITNSTRYSLAGWMKTRCLK
jgi:SM-20-related protein